MIRVIALVFLYSASFSFLTATAVSAQPAECSQPSLEIVPSETTYQAGEQIEVRINNPIPGYPVQAHFTRTSQDTSDISVWTEIPLTYDSGQDVWKGNWTITSSVPGPYFYNDSAYQEFFIVANVFDPSWNLICTGNPFYPPGSGYPAAPSANLRKVIITEPIVSSPSYSLKDFFNVKPGYSLTYLGKRLDGAPVTNFKTRIEYEAPVEICPNMPLIPQRFTKDSIYGYHAPGDGTNLRFLLTDYNAAYSWNSDYLSSPIYKIYKPASFKLSNLGTFDHSSISTTYDFENYYYPPYLVALKTIGQSDIAEFVRLDTFRGVGSEDPVDLCSPTVKDSAHRWYSRTQKLTDTGLKSEFFDMLGFFPGKNIIVITFFETSEHWFGGKIFFREDWYLMHGVGLVGIDTVFFNPPIDNTSPLYNTYFNTLFMKQGTSAAPDIVLRANRAYLGNALDISITPKYVKPGESYILTATSKDTGMPYDGYLQAQVNGGSTQDWQLDGQLIWVTNGSVVVNLPTTFPEGTYTARFRPRITLTPSGQETQLSFSQMPWGNYATLTVTDTPPPPGDGDLDGDYDVDWLDLKTFIQYFVGQNTQADWDGDLDVDVFDFNLLVAGFGQ